MTRHFPKLYRLRKNEDGTTIIEFAIIAPIFVFMLLGTFEIGYAIYMRSALNGAVQQAARDATLQQGNDPTKRKEIDDRVRDMLQAINGDLKDSDIKISRKNYTNFSSVERMEDYTDTNGNGTCDNNEVYDDENGNGKWGTVGYAGNGGARDAVLYNVTISYDAVFPLDTFVRDSHDKRTSFTLNGLADRRTMEAETLLKNQPFGDQGTRGGGANRNCVDEDDIDDDEDYEDDYEEGEGNA